MGLRPTVARRSGEAVCRVAGSLCTASAPRLAVQQPVEHDVEQPREPRVPLQPHPWAAPPPPPAAARRTTAALAVVHRPAAASLLQRTLDTAASALHRCVMAVAAAAVAAAALCTFVSCCELPRSLLPLLQPRPPTSLPCRLLMLVGSLRRLSASEAYVRRYLEQHVGLDTFSLEYLHISHPQVLRLSVARDIEPAVSWLRWAGDTGAAQPLLGHS